MKKKSSRKCELTSFGYDLQISLGGRFLVEQERGEFGINYYIYEREGRIFRRWKWVASIMAEDNPMNIWGDRALELYDMSLESEMWQRLESQGVKIIKSLPPRSQRAEVEVCTADGESVCTIGKSTYIGAGVLVGLVYLAFGGASVMGLGLGVAAAYGIWCCIK